MTAISVMNTGKQDLAIIAITKRGTSIGRMLKAALPGSHLYIPGKFSAPGQDERIFTLPARSLIENIFDKYRQLVLIMAVGIAVRLIAGRINNKHRDAAVAVIDDTGKFVISLLSGHIGGANELTRQISSLLGAQPVITTTSDNSEAFSIDLLAKSLGWEIENQDCLTRVSAALVNDEPVALYQDTGEYDWTPGDLPQNVHIITNIDTLRKSDYGAAVIITDRIVDGLKLKMPTVILRPKSLVVGIGCNRGTNCSEIKDAVARIFSENGLSTRCIQALATIDLKNNETGLLQYAEKYNLPVRYFSKEHLSQAEFPSEPSEMVLKHVGTPAVCEAAAVLAGNGNLIIKKTGYNRKVTVAVARRLSESAEKRGKLFLVDIGPGAPDQMTFRARQAINDSEAVIGYQAYIDFIRPLLHQKTVFATTMGKEIERVNRAIDLARQGKVVSLISSGDSGVYGMAGLVGEILLQQNSKPAIELIPGVPAMVTAGALLGAPLNSDVATISLSNYLVPWEDIEQRLHLAAKGDFVIVLYNPKSKKRRQELEKAKNIVLQYRSRTSPVGIVTNAYRPEQNIIFTDLDNLTDCPVDMNTIIIIGNSKTIISSNWMVTPRGYQTKYKLDRDEK